MPQPQPAAADPARDAALAEIARVHLGFGTLDWLAADHCELDNVTAGQIRAALVAAYAAGRGAPRTAAPERAPDCTTTRAAQIAGIIANAVMAGEMSLGQDFTPAAVEARIPGPKWGPAFGADLAEGFRVAGLMISARARASVRTPDHAALSAAEAALALVEDCLNWIPIEDGEPPEDAAVLASVRDVLSAGLAPRHTAERAAAQAPYDAGLPSVVTGDDAGPSGA